MTSFSIVLYVGASLLGIGCVILLSLTIRNLMPAPAGPGLATFGIDMQIDGDNDSSAKRSRHLVKQLAMTGELSPAHLVGENLSPTAASLGFANLEFIARSILDSGRETPYLYGVNRGGALLANLLSQRLGLSQKYLVRCDYRKDWDKVICEPRPSVTRVIVVDDVVRTGDTIRKVKAALREMYPDISLYCIALVVVESGTPRRSVLEVIDYAAWISRFQGVGLPWSNSREDDPRGYFDEEGMAQLVGRLVEHSKKVAIG